MINTIKTIIFLSIFSIISGCSSHVALSDNSKSYQYKGEKYGKVVISYAEEISQDSNKMVRLDQMNLKNTIVRFLRTENLYDESSNDIVRIEIQKLHVRNAFNAIMFGFMSGSDNIKGVVVLEKSNKDLADFDVSASYSLGGIAGGQNETRLSWLSEKFAELTSKTIIGKPE